MPNQNYGNSICRATRYRIVDRSVKLFCKKASVQSNEKQRSKRKRWQQEQQILNSHKDKDEEFDWNTVINLHNNCDDERLTEVQIEGIHCADMDREHNCKCSGSASNETLKFFTVKGAPSGLFLVRNALCLTSQIHWAKKAVEEYSNAEHTNLTNLAKLNGDTTEADISLWDQSRNENNNFQKFKAMRWSCLGYHYGKPCNTIQCQITHQLPIKQTGPIDYIRRI